MLTSEFLYEIPSKSWWSHCWVLYYQSRNIQIILQKQMPFCHSCVFPILFKFPKDQLQDNSLWLSHVTLFKGESWPPNKCFVDHLWGPDDGDGTWKIEVQRRFCWWNLQKFNLVVVFNISFDVHPYLGMIFDLTKNLSDGLKPPTMIV